MRTRQTCPVCLLALIAVFILSVLGLASIVKFGMSKLSQVDQEYSYTPAIMQASVKGYDQIQEGAYSPPPGLVCFRIKWPESRLAKHLEF